MREFILWVAGVFLILAIIAVPITLCMNWDYRWKQTCIQQGGVYLRPAESSGSRICVRGPIEVIPIAVSPF